MSDPYSCLNCEAPLHGEFCSNCGQSSKGINHFFLTLINEAFEEVFSRNSRFWKTLIYLLFRPGMLSQEYCKGRRVSYIRPVKLYFFTSIIFFVTIAMINFYKEVSSFDSDDGVTLLGKKVEVQIIQDEEIDTAQISEDIAENNDVSDLVDSEEDTIDVFIHSLSIETETGFPKLIKTKLKTAIESIEQDPNIAGSILLDFAPPVIFCLLPLFALLLKLSYLTKRVYYTEHLILALHNHSFLFLMLTLNLVIALALHRFNQIAEVLMPILFLWIPIYMWLSMKYVYKQGSLATSLKYIILGTSYLTLVLSGIVLCFIFGVMTF